MDVYANREYIISSITIQDTVIEVTYFDKNNQGENVAMVQSLIISIETYQEGVNAILDECEEMIEAGLVELRNPPKTLTPKERLIAGQSARAEAPVDPDVEEYKREVDAAAVVMDDEL